MMKTEPHAVSRRDLIIAGGGRLAAWSLMGAGLPTLLRGPQWAPARQGSDPGADVLVCVFLRGGLDGLSAVVPMFEDSYYRQRPTLAISEARSGDNKTAIDLDGRFGLHPSLHPLKDIWDAGHLAVIHAAGSPDPTHSHFDAMDYMERGTPGDSTLTTGWIARHLSTAPREDGSSLDVAQGSPSADLCR
jgi:uncharacterized protein (DUF1501 family)